MCSYLGGGRFLLEWDGCTLYRMLNINIYLVNMYFFYVLYNIYFSMCNCCFMYVLIS